MTATPNSVLPPKTGTKVGNAVIPAEGPIAVPYNLNFALSLSYTINVRDLLNTGPGYPGLSRIQALWIDNSSNSSELTVQITQTNQTIDVPPGSQGYYSVLSPNAGQINFSTGAGPFVFVSVLNFPVGGNQWYPSGLNGGDTYTGGYLNTLDATLAAIKGTTSSANALPVSVVGSAGANTSFFSSILTPNSALQSLITKTGAGLIINSLYASFSGNSYDNTHALMSVFFSTTSGNVPLAASQFYLPNAAPAASASGSPPIQVIKEENLNLLINDSLSLYYNGNISSGTLFIGVGYQQSSL